MVTLSHVPAAKCGINREKEIKREQEREGKEPYPKKREGDRNIFHDSTLKLQVI